MEDLIRLVSAVPLLKVEVEGKACDRMSWAVLRLKVVVASLERVREVAVPTDCERDAVPRWSWLVAVTMVVAVMAGEMYQLLRELVLLGRRAYHRGDFGVRPSVLMGRDAACEADADGKADGLELLRSMTELAVLMEGGS